MRFAANSPKVGANLVFFLLKMVFFEFAGIVLFCATTNSRENWLFASEWDDGAQKWLFLC